MINAKVVSAASKARDWTPMLSNSAFDNSSEVPPIALSIVKKTTKNYRLKLKVVYFEMKTGNQKTYSQESRY